MAILMFTECLREGVELMYLRTTKVQLTQQVKDWNRYISNDRICFKSLLKLCWFDCAQYSWWHIRCRCCLVRAYPAQPLYTTVLGRLKSFGLSLMLLMCKDSCSHELSETRTTTKLTRNRHFGCLASNSCCHDQVLDCFDSAGPYIHIRTVHQLAVIDSGSFGDVASIGGLSRHVSWDVFWRKTQFARFARQLYMTDRDVNSSLIHFMAYYYKGFMESLVHTAEDEAQYEIYPDKPWTTGRLAAFRGYCHVPESMCHTC